MSFKNYSDDVLPSTMIYSVFQDSKGFMWFGSDRGICRFDGYSFTKFAIRDGVPDNEVFDFFEDSRHRIWLQTSNGKVAYYKDGHIVNGQSDTTLAKLDSKSFIGRIIEDRLGNLWMCTSLDGIISYQHDGSIKRFPISEKEFGIVHGIEFIGPNELFLLTNIGAYTVLLNSTHTDIIKNESTGFSWTALGNPKLTSYGNHVLFNHQLGVYHYDIRTRIITPLYKMKMGEEYIYNLTQDEEFVWLCGSKGAIPYRKRDGKFLHHVLKNRRGSAVHKDFEGNYWFATVSDGVFYSTSFNIYGWSTRDGLASNRVTCLDNDNKGRVWVGYEGKGVVSCVDRGSIRHVQVAHPSLFERNKVYDITCTGSQVWIGTNTSICLIENGRVDLIRNYCKYLVRFGQHVWSANGAYAFNILVSDFLRTKIPAIEYRQDDRWLEKIKYKDPVGEKWFLNGTPRGLSNDGDSLLWVFSEYGLYKFQNDSMELLNLSHAGDVLAVQALCRRKDKTIVVATGGHGVGFLDDGKIIAMINQSNGLSSNTCTSLCIDKNQNIWVGTNHGLNKITGYPNNTTVEYFTTTDGLFSNEVTGIAISNDTVWAGTRKGLNYFHINATRKQRKAPVMTIDAVTLHGKTVSHTSREALVFRHSENDISIKYTGISFSSGGDVVYRYKLHVQDEWRYTRNTSVYLPELGADHYTFVVAAKSPFSAWSKEISVSFVIEKAYWQTMPFKIAMVALIIGTIAIGITLYLRNQKKKLSWAHRASMSELRSLRAQMNPHFIFNALNAIKGALLQNKVEKADDYLSRFSKLMRQVLDHADKTASTLADEIDLLKNYLDIEQLRPANCFQYQIEVASAIDVHLTEIPAMIIQPFVENAIWHGFAQRHSDNHLRVRFSLNNDDDVVITVQDNGIGRQRASELDRRTLHRSKGIQLVKERIEVLNFNKTRKITLYIDDLTDNDGNANGTLVTIKIPSS